MSASSEIGESLKTAFERKDEVISLVAKTTADKLKLFVDITRLDPSQSSAISLEQVRKLIEGVRADFVHEPILLHIVKEFNEGKEIKERRLARGRPAEEGRDGKVLLLVKKLQNAKGGTIEFVDPRL